MGDPGMKTAPVGQTTIGGECMEIQEITLGAVTYEVRRVYAGERTAAELVLDRMTQSQQETASFDQSHTQGV